MKGATLRHLPVLLPFRFQSAPPVKGATRPDPRQQRARIVSIRAPREGGDLWWMKGLNADEGFQSAPPVKGATIAALHHVVIHLVSIRAPREGGDGRERSPARPMPVSIRAPREGGDELYGDWHDYAGMFQSAPPVKGATAKTAAARANAKFQSAPPVKGATGCRFPSCPSFQFQSAPPVKGATQEFERIVQEIEVSIRAPREGGDGISL